MKILKYIINSAMMLGTVCLLAMPLGCNEKVNPENPDEPGNPEKPAEPSKVQLDITPATLAFAATGGEQTITVDTNADEWNCETGNKWFTIVKVLDEITVKAQINDSDKPREGEIRILAKLGDNTAEATVKVKQDGKSNEHKPGTVYFEDLVFKQFILDYFDLDHDGEISEKEAGNVRELDCGSLEVSELFTSLRGVECFKNLTVLYCEGNLLTELDLSGLDKLEFLDCNHNKIKTLTLTGCSALTALHCHFNNIDALDIKTNCPDMQFVNCGNNEIQHLDVSNMSELQYLACEKNGLKDLNVEGCAKLGTLACFKNELTELNIENQTAIYNLMCNDNQIPELKLGKLSALTQLECSNNYLEGALDLTQNTEMKILRCGGNRLNDIQIQNCSGITTFDCADTKIEGIDVSHMKELKNFNISVNFLTKGINVSENRLLEKFYCANTHISELDVTSNDKLVELICDDNELTVLDVSCNPALNLLYALGNPLEILYMAEGQNISDLKLDDVSVIKRK